MTLDLYLRTNTEVDIEITPNSDDFMILQSLTVAGQPEKKFKLELVNIALQVKSVDLMDGLSLEINNKLNHEPARYGIRKTSIKSMFISAGRRDFMANIFSEGREIFNLLFVLKRL
jgi:hypothetical protein